MDREPRQFRGKGQEMNSEDKMHIPSLKRYITMTYKKLGDGQLANYWNLGYINCLMDNKIIDRSVGAGLVGYNDRIYFVEGMKIIERKNKIDGYFFPELRDLAINAIGYTGYGEWINFKREVNKMIKIGDTVKDTITDLEGTAVAKIIYMNGCIQYEVQPKKLKDGLIVKSAWVDEGQLIVKKKAEIKKDKEKPPGGSGSVPSERSHPLKI